MTSPSDVAIAPDDFSDLAAPSAPSADQEALVERDFVWNAFAGLLFEGTWALGASFVIISVLIPTYLNELNSPKRLIGLMSAVGTLTVPLQLLAGHFLDGERRKVKLWIAYAGCGLAYVVLGICGMLIEGRLWRIVSFCFWIAIFFVLSNSLSPVYNGLLADNCPMRRRGRLYGYRAVMLGGIGLLGLYPARLILDRFSGMNVYHAATLFAGTIFFFSSLCCFMFRDHFDVARAERQLPPKGAGLCAILRDAMALLPRLLRSANFRVFIFFAIVIAAASSIGPFIITYTRDTLATESAPNLSLRFRALFLIASIVNGIVVATIPDRFGYKIMLGAQALVGLAAFGVALIAHSLHLAMLAYALQACMSFGMGAVLTNLSIELMPRVTSTRLIAAANVMCLPCNVLVPWLAGTVLDIAHGATWGYHIIFSIAMTLAAVGGIGAMALVQEPRTGRVYEIKVMERV